MALDWNQINPKEFEELIFHLLAEEGFYNLEWFGKGGGDRGRDVTGTKIEEPLSGQKLERKWVVQCKHTSRLNKLALEKDLAAALEHKPDYWLLCTSLCLTSDQRDWLHSVESNYNCRFKIICLDQPQLEILLGKYAKIKEQFFPRETKKVIILPPRLLEFIGREQELAEVEKKLKDKKYILIWGPPGVGKTALASEIVWKFKEHFTGGVIWHFALESTFEDILNTIIRAFSESTIIGLPLKEKITEVQLLFSRNPNTLLYLDNVEDIEVIRFLENICQFCSIILTSRHYAAFGWLNEIKLDMLARDSSIKLFENTYKNPISDNERQCVNEICEILGDLPLAIELCGDRARISKIYIGKLPDLLKEASGDRRLLDFLQIAGQGVTGSIKLTYNNLDSSTQEFFAMLSVFGGRTFSINAVKEIWNKEDAREKLFLLTYLSLVKPVGNERYGLHPIIQSFAEIMLKDYENYMIYYDPMIQYFLKYVEDNRTNFDRLEIERENILAAMQLCYEKGKSDTYLKFADAMLKMYPGAHYAYGFLLQRGYWTEGSRIGEQCLEISKQASDLSAIAKFNEHLGLFYYSFGEHEQAMRHYEEALENYKDQKDYKGEAIILHRLGFIYSDEGDYRKAEEVYRRSVKIAEEHQLDEETLATGIHLVGTVLYHQGRYRESQAKLEEALKMREKSSKAASAVTQRRLAATLRCLGCYEKAYELLGESLKVEQEKNERNIARCLRQLGMLAQAQGEIKKARGYFEEGHQIFKRIGNKKGISCVLTNLGEVNLAEGKLTDAKEQFQEGLGMARHLKSRYGIAINLKGLGKIWLLQKDYKQAIVCLIEAIKNLESIHYVHLEDTCNLFNEAILGLDTPRVYFSSGVDIYEGRCAQEIRSKFDSLCEEAKRRLREANPQIDSHLLNKDQDKRLGISLIARPSEESIQILTKLSDKLRTIAPGHYYYKPNEFHITVMSLINASESFRLEDVSIEKYKQVFAKIFSQHRPFRVHFKGVTATTSCVMAQGFFSDGTLDAIRDELRDEVVRLGIEKEIDARYKNISAHVTLLRFKNDKNLKELSEEIEKLRDCELGVSSIDRIEFVLNDWYLSEEKVRVLDEYPLEGCL